ncbi:Aste57867_995 [Aphanomyces stellatus]|uniref:Aste57867_995 protein n=1 Tax=Aphanomyces stellatus TaxID=120398 RepID=A0A485K543_9STRA|nr:hypothetical protein As57867_000994 [Aphanomyces stellatus]VFT78217.1 Aste57867_995 [Aphanomyces stellatus]
MKRDYTLKHAASNRLLPKIERPLLQKKHSVPTICLTPIEAMSSHEAQLSARNVAHRTPAHFENLIKSSTWVLKNALASESSRPIRELHVRFSRAYASYRMNDFVKALADFTHCVEIEPAWHLVYYNRACTYYKLGRVDEAIQDIGKAIKYDSKNKVYLESRATLMRELGRFKEAIEDYNRIDTIAAAADDASTTRTRTPTPSVVNRRYSTLGKIAIPEDGIHAALANLLHTPPAERTRYDIVNVLPQVKSWRFFQQKTEKVQVDFLTAASLRSYAPRSYVFHQGDDPDLFYIIITGSVAVSIEVFENGVINTKKVCTLLAGDGFGEPHGMQGPRRANVTTLGTVHCLAVTHAIYEEAMADHMESVYQDKCQVLRQCRVFESCSDDVIERIAHMASVLLFEPYRTILKAGELVDKLYVIKRGVCYVTKSLPLEPTKDTKRPSTMVTAAGAAGKKKGGAYDGSWVVDNGWQLTNPRLRNEFLDTEADRSPSATTVDVTVATLTTGQVFGEVCVLRHNQPSTVTVLSSTMVQVLELAQEELAQLNLKFNSRTMNALQASFLFHNPPNPKIAQLYKEREAWQRSKAKIVRDVLNGGKQTGLVKKVASEANKPLAELHHRSSFYDTEL